MFTRTLLHQQPSVNKYTVLNVKQNRLKVLLVFANKLL